MKALIDEANAHFEKLLQEWDQVHDTMFQLEDVLNRLTEIRKRP
jgi:uncharacterized protein YdcH (DUF465 family)